MQIKNIFSLMLGLALYSTAIAQDEMPGVQPDHMLVPEDTADMGMGIQSIEHEELAMLIRQDCQTMALDEGLTGGDAAAYTESCIADIMSIDSEMELTDEEMELTEEDAIADEGMLTDDEYAEVAAVADEEVIPLISE